MAARWWLLDGCSTIARQVLVGISGVDNRIIALERSCYAQFILFLSITKATLEFVLWSSDGQRGVLPRLRLEENNLR